jgi:hypothetical protein
MRMILSSHVPMRPSALPSLTAAWEPRWEVMVRSLLKMTGTFQILFVILSAVSHARVVDRTELETPNIVIEWDNAALQGVRDSKLGPPMVARALAIVHTCMYDAWAAYDDRARGTQLGKALRQPYGLRTLDNKKEAISFAAYRAVVDLFQLDEATLYRPLMTSLGYDPDNTTTGTTTPAGVGNTACAAVLRYRHNDGSNQSGLMSSSGVPYSDYTGYEPVNPPTTVPVILTSILDPNRWQPLQYTDQTGAFVTQVFLGAQWNRVVPFAVRSDDQFRAVLSSFGPAHYGSTAYREQAEELLEFSAKLTDEQKMIAEYWKDGPHSETPPGHWALLAQFVSMRDHHTLDQDVKMFFAVTNATLDASIVAWDAKRAFDSVRPATAICYLFHGQQIRSWGGPGKGTVIMDGADWLPYQPASFPTPPFPEFISGHSTFSAAAARVLELFTGRNWFGASVTFAPGTSAIEPGITPAVPVVLYWDTFTDAANQAGISRRYGGIHFKAADLTGRAVGKVVGFQVWQKVVELWEDREDHQPEVQPIFSLPE